MAASLAGRTNLGRRRTRRVHTTGDESTAMLPRSAGCDGFTPSGGTAVGELDREGSRATFSSSLPVYRPSTDLEWADLRPPGGRAVRVVLIPPDGLGFLVALAHRGCR